MSTPLGGSMIGLLAYTLVIEMKHPVSEVYFQEPRFTALDREFLTSRGHTILTTPESNEFINEETFLFTPYAPRHIVAVTLQKVHPAIFFGQRIDDQTHFHINPGTKKSVKHLNWTCSLVDDQQMVSRKCRLSTSRVS